MSDQFEGNCWPKGMHLKLMQAALLEKDIALNAWHAWASQIDMDQLDYVSYQVISLLYQNLKKMHVAHPLMPKLKGIYQRMWAENQRMMMLFADVVECLNRNGIHDIVLMKGSAMILSHYQDFGLRHMGDIDFLVPKAQASDALATLECLGYQSDIDLEQCMRTHHGINVCSDRAPFNQLKLDLHWQLLYKIDSDMIEKTGPVKLHHVNVYTLSPTLLLYQACVHGTQYSPFPLTRWVLDAYTLIAHQSHVIDWAMIIQRAQDDHCVLPILDAFTFLKKHFDAPIPQDVLHQLQKMKVILLEKLFFRANQHRWYRLLLVLPELWHLHYRSQDDYSLKQALIQFPSFLKARWGVPHIAFIPLMIPFKVFKILTRTQIPK